MRVDAEAPAAFVLASSPFPEPPVLVSPPPCATRPVSLPFSASRVGPAPEEVSVSGVGTAAWQLTIPSALTAPTAEPPAHVPVTRRWRALASRPSSRSACRLATSSAC